MATEEPRRPIIGDPIWYWDAEQREWRASTVENVFDRGPQAPYYLIEGTGSTLFSHRLVADGAGPRPVAPPDSG